MRPLFAFLISIWAATALSAPTGAGFTPPEGSAAVSPVPAGPEGSQWKVSEWEQMGERKVRAGFSLLGLRPAFSVYLSKGKEAKPVAVSHVKVTMLDRAGKPIVVARHYDYPNFVTMTSHDWACFDFGTFVQKVKPEDVGSVTLAGFGGKVQIRFEGGNAVPAGK